MVNICEYGTGTKYMETTYQVFHNDMSKEQTLIKAL